MSPVELIVPLITISALMMEGAESARVRLGWACWAAGASAGVGVASLLLLENMAASLDEFVGVLYGVIVPDFIMDMWPGAAARRADAAQCHAPWDLHPDPNAD